MTNLAIECGPTDRVWIYHYPPDCDWATFVNEPVGELWPFIIVLGQGDHRMVMPGHLVRVIHPYQTGCRMATIRRVSWLRGTEWLASTRLL